MPLSRKAGNIVSIAVVIAAVAVALLFRWLGRPDGSRPALSSAPEAAAPVVPSIPEAERIPQRIAELEKLLRQHPTHAPIALELANHHSNLRNHSEAEKYYRLFLQHDSSSDGWEIGLDLARAVYSLGREREAEEILKEMLRYHPDYSDALYNLGAIAANRGDTARAIELWEQVMVGRSASAVKGMAQGGLDRLTGGASR